MAVKNHVHTYERIPKERGQIRYKCSDPDCTHVMLRSQLKGKRSKCWGCGNTYILMASHLEKARPHCGCLTGKPNSEKSMDESIIEDMIAGIEGV